MLTNGEKGSSHRLWPWAIIVFGGLLAGFLVVTACTSGMNTSGSGMGTANVMLSDPATCQAPNGSFSAVWVTITDVQANTSATAGDSDSGWVDLTPNLSKSPMQVNLLGTPNNQCFLATLGDNLELQAGTYQQIRLMLAPNSGTTYGTNCGSANNCVVLSDGTTHTLALSSEAQTGIKIPSGQIASGAFTISAGQTRDLDIDFDTCDSIVEEGNGQFRLKPVLHAAEVSTTAVSMNGKVVDAAGNPVVGATVAIEQPDGTDGNSNPIDRFLMAATTASDGTWVICPLVVGDTTKPYDVVVTGSTSTGILFAPSIVTGVSIGSTVGTVTLNASAGATTAALSTATITGQVTSSTGTGGVVIDAYLSVLETVNKVDYTIPLPTVTTPAQAGGRDVLVTTLATANGTLACPANTDCYDYTLQTEAAGSYIGAWSSSGATLTQPSLVPIYLVDGNATHTGDTTLDCSPSEVMSSAIALASTPLAGTANLAFTGCTL